MKKPMKSLVRYRGIALAVAFLSASLTGCESSDKSVQEKKSAKAAQKRVDKPKVVAKKQTLKESSPQKPAPRVIAKKTPPAPQPAADPPTIKTLRKGEQDSQRQAELTSEEIEAKRARAEDMIYATIRIKMDEMVERRAELLKGGREPSDPEVRSLEGSIMRARELLLENGEIVEEIDPPIVQRVPKS